MEQKFINIGDKTYKCKIAKSEEHKEKIKTNNKQSKVTILLEIATGKTFEFNSARQASLWLGLDESAVGHAIKDNYLLQNRKFKAYRKNETSQS